MKYKHRSRAESGLGCLTSGCTDGQKVGLSSTLCRHPSVSHVTRITKKTYLAASGLSGSTSDLYCIMHTDCSTWPWLLYVMQLDLSSLTRDQTYIPCIVRQILHLWTTKEVPTRTSFYYPSLHLVETVKWLPGLLSELGNASLIHNPVRRLPKSKCFEIME